MQILGFELIVRRKGAEALAPVDASNRGWFPLIREAYSGAWQRNVTLDTSIDNVATHPTVFACVTLLAATVAKLGWQLQRQRPDGTWLPFENSAYSPVLRRPNRFSTRLQFVEHWLLCKALYGNAYVLKQRDSRGVVEALYVLSPSRVRPMVTPDGDVYYELRADNISGLTQDVVIVPASEVIHDRWHTLFHPLVGNSPLFAASVAAGGGLNMLANSAAFFGNAALPSGVLTAPGAIAKETADRVKDYWNDAFTRDNAGKVAVLGDGLKYEAMTMSAVDAQLIDQMKWTSEQICSVYHVPAFMVGIGAMPNYANVESLTTQFYSQTVQSLCEAIELCLGDGLGLARDYKLGFDLADLFKADTATFMKTLSDGVKAAILAPNEARKRLNLPPVEGGDSPLAQQQDYSLSAIARRDAQQPAPTAGGETKSPKPRLFYRGDWRPEQVYRHHDLVIHEGKTWACRVGVTTRATPGGDAGICWQPAQLAGGAA